MHRNLLVDRAPSADSLFDVRHAVTGAGKANMKCAVTAVSMAVVGVTTATEPTTASAPPPDPELVRELEFAD